MEDNAFRTINQVQEAPDKPNIIKIVSPFVVTGLIFWWLYWSMDLVALQAALSKAHLGLAIGVMVVYCLIFTTVDVISFGLGYKWYLTNKVTWKDVMVIRCGMFLLQIALAPVAEVIPPAYFLRKWRVKVLHTIGSEMYVLFCDNYCNITLLTLGLIFGGLILGMGWLYFVIFQWLLLAVTWLYWLTPLLDRLLPRLREAAMLHSFRKAPLRHYFAFYGVRLVLMLSNLVACWTLLDALDVRLPVTHLFLLAPVVMLSTFLPISAGGYGGPQGAAVLMLVTLWNHTTQEVAVAYSLLWSTLFAIGRGAIGAIFAWPVWNLLQERNNPMDKVMPDAVASGSIEGE